MVLKLKMRDRLDKAIDLAKEIDSWASLSSIVGIKLYRDGAVHLGTKDDYVSRWQYAFMNDMDGEAPTKYITVTYWMNGQEPVVDKKVGNVSDTVPFEKDMVARLENSDQLVSMFHQESEHKMMGGHDQDVIVYRMERPLAPTVTLMNWKGQSLILDPVTLERIMP